MKLYLMRHAEAESGDRLDPTRGLTDTGKLQARMMAKWLDRQVDKPDLVMESNMRRSHQTAKRLSKRLDCEVQRSGALDPDGTPEGALTAMQQIGRAAGARAVIAVSHGPLVEEILAYLTGGQPDQFHFAHAAVAHFELTGSVSEARGEYYYDEVEVKRWVLGDGGNSGNCDWCEEAADLGWIDMDEIFPGPDGDVDEAPLHPNCTCTVEQKTKRRRIYAADRTPPEGVRLYEAQATRPTGILHWLVTPDTVARDEKEMDAVTSDAMAAVEAACALAVAAIQ